jgi:hypothetical protein
LLGHINIGMRMVAEKVRTLPDFPRTLRSLVEHMILSHHGQLEYGSPKLPQFPEALLLHFLDDMDSKMECMRALIQNDRQVEGCFTTYSTALTRAALKKERYMTATVEASRSRTPDASAQAEARFNAPETRPNGNPVSQSNPSPGPHVPPPPVAPVIKPQVASEHPLFRPKPDSIFADKLKQALQPKQDN